MQLGQRRRCLPSSGSAGFRGEFFSALWGCWLLGLGVVAWVLDFPILVVAVVFLKGRCRMIFGESLIQVRMGVVYAGVLYLSMYVRCLGGLSTLELFSDVS